MMDQMKATSFPEVADSRMDRFVKYSACPVELKHSFRPFSFRAQLAFLVKKKKMSFDVVFPELGDTLLNYQT